VEGKKKTDHVGKKEDHVEKEEEEEDVENCYLIFEV